MLEDDIDGGEAERTVSFAFDGVEYEIDLSAANAAALAEALALHRRGPARQRPQGPPQRSGGRVALIRRGRGRRD